MSVLTEAQRAQMDRAIAAMPKANELGLRGRAASYDSTEGVDGEEGPHRPLFSGKKKCVAKKGGAGGKGTWGALLDMTETPAAIDRGDPNYDSTNSDESSNFQSPGPLSPFQAKATDAIVDYKAKVKGIIEEYFNTADLAEATARLQDLNVPLYQHFIVKRVVTMALDRQSRELEMAARLLSGAYGKAITPDEMQKGFTQLVQSADDIKIDVPEAASLLGVFIARGVVDDILPPAFVKQAREFVSDNGNVAFEALKHCESLLGGRHAAERLLQVWGSAVVPTVEEAKEKMKQLLVEYLESSGDASEAVQCLRDLKMPFFHHELVKRALTLAVEKRDRDQDVLKLLAVLSSSGAISANQMAVGFVRMEATVPDLQLDVPEAPQHVAGLRASALADDVLDPVMYEAALAAEETAHQAPSNGASNGHTATITTGAERDLIAFKAKATQIIREYFSAGDVAEVNTSLQELQERVANGPKYLPIFVKRLLVYSMDFQAREKEKAAVLLSMLYPAPLAREDIEAGFLALMDAAEDLTLDVPDAPGHCSLFLARAVIDDLLAPSFLSDLAAQFEGRMGSEVARAAQTLLGTRHVAVRVLRAWGGEEGGTVAHTKEQMVSLLQEYTASQDLTEAARCLHALHVPFYHHELVKKALTIAIEQPDSASSILLLLATFSKSGQVSVKQVQLGFARMAEVVEDLALDVPGASDRLGQLSQQAQALAILEPPNLTPEGPPPAPKAMSYAAMCKRP